MAITGRVPLLLLLGVVAVVLRPAVSTMWLWVLVVLLLVGLDVALARLTGPDHRGATAGRPRPGRASRPRPRWSSATTARAVRRCSSATPGSRPPARPATGTGSGSPPATGPLLTTSLLPERRGRPARVGVTVRIRRTPRPGVAASTRDVDRPGPGAAALRVPQAPAEPAGPAARPGRTRRGAGARSGHRVRLAAGVRPGRRRPLDRLAGQRPQPHRRRTHLAARARPAGRAGARHLPRTSAGRIGDVPRLDSAMDAALLLAALAARAGDRVDFVAGDRRVRSRLRFAGTRDVDEPTAGRDGRLLQPVIAEADWTALAGAVNVLGRQRALVVLLTPPRAVGGRGGAAARATGR